MSFLRPTASSRSRANAARESSSSNNGNTGVTPSPVSAASGVPPPQSRQLFHATSAADFAHVTPRVDTGLHSRVLGSALARPARSRPPSTTPPSTSLQEFTAKCDAVMKRAQELLERSRDQEALAARALEQRLSQSPLRRASSQGAPLPADGTPVGGSARKAVGGSWFGGSASPQLPRAPHTTPVGSLQQQHEQARRFSDPAVGSSTPEASERRRSGLFGFLSPQRSPLPPPPPPTPAQDPRSPTPPGRASPSKPSLYSRVCHSLQRLSGVLPPAPASSPVPPPPPTPQRDVAPASSVSPARKSVRFVSPDKLESVTPTQCRLSQVAEQQQQQQQREEKEEEVPVPLHVTFAEEVLAAEEEKPEETEHNKGKGDGDEEDIAPRSSKGRTPPKRSRSRSVTASPQRSPSPKKKAAKHEDKEEEEEVVPPVAAPTQNKSSSRSPAKTKGASPVKAAKTSPAKAATTSTPQRDSTSGRSSSKGSRASSVASSTSSARAATREHHLAMVAFIKSNTIKRSLAAYKKEELLECLHAEGVPHPPAEHTKKQLLDELRGLLGMK